MLNRSFGLRNSGATCPHCGQKSSSDSDITGIAGERYFAEIGWRKAASGAGLQWAGVVWSIAALIAFVYGVKYVLTMGLFGFIGIALIVFAAALVCAAIRCFKSSSRILAIERSVVVKERKPMERVGGNMKIQDRSRFPGREILWATLVLGVPCGFLIGLSDFELGPALASLLRWRG